MFFIYLPTAKGIVAEWLGTGLQNRLPRFESGRCLWKPTHLSWFFYYNKPSTQVLPIPIGGAMPQEQTVSKYDFGTVFLF